MIIHNRSLDHYVPKSKGGRNTFDNLVTACRQCNNRKGDDMPHDAKPIKEDLREGLAMPRGLKNWEIGRAKSWRLFPCY